MDATTIQHQIIEDFSARTEWFDKYELLIALGREFDASGPGLKTEANRISGCQSEVWLHAELRDGRMHILADSDALITRGILSLVLRVLNRRTPAEIINTHLDFIDEIGLKSNLSPARSDGLAAILNAIGRQAEAFHFSAQAR